MGKATKGERYTYHCDGCRATFTAASGGRRYTGCTQCNFGIAQIVADVPPEAAPMPATVTATPEAAKRWQDYARVRRLYGATVEEQVRQVTRAIARQINEVNNPPLCADCWAPLSEPAAFTDDGLPLCQACGAADPAATPAFRIGPMPSGEPVPGGEAVRLAGGGYAVPVTSEEMELA